MMAVQLQTLVLSGSLLASTLAQNSTKIPVVDLGYASYAGLRNEPAGLNEFYGLPFSEPLTPELRWKAARPISNNTSTFSPMVQNASNIASEPICTQGNPYWIGPNSTIPAGTEDCLILNVYQPANATASSELPVMVTIHGGGYTLGQASFMDPHALLRHSSNGFVFVSLQYRLGAYGFMGSQRFISEGGDANLGLQDQRLGLEWVQKYIHHFGGDPKKVTINGGSAGGGSVTSQMIWKGGEDYPPFRAAIAEFPWWQQLLRDEQLEQQYEYLLAAANCTSLTCLRALPADKLAIATQATYAMGYKDGEYGYGSFYYGPYVDGDLIQDLPSREFKNGNFAKVPTLVDRDMYEGASFTNFSLTTMDEEDADLEIQFPYADEDFVEDLYDHYPANDYNSTFFQRVQWFGDFSIQCPTYYIASSLASHNVPVYKLIFNAGSQTHSATTVFLTDPSPAFPSAGYNTTIADSMQEWFTSFVMHNDPNAQSHKSPTWPLYNVEQGAGIMMVNYTSIASNSDEWFDTSARCDWLWENGAIVQN